jgi:hypothetical protein
MSTSTAPSAFIFRGDPRQIGPALVALKVPVILAGTDNVIVDVGLEVINNYSSITAGKDNTIKAQMSGIMCGYSNYSNSRGSFIGGGGGNSIGKYASYSVVTGGINNNIQWQRAGSNQPNVNCFIGGGSANIIRSDDSTLPTTPFTANNLIGAGSNNLVKNCASSLVGCGTGNIISNSEYTGVLCGIGNSVSDASHAVVLGGANNTLTGALNTFVLGTICSITNMTGGFVAGASNTVSSGGNSTIIGNSNSVTSASGTLITNSSTLTSNGGKNIALFLFGKEFADTDIDNRDEIVLKSNGNAGTGVAVKVLTNTAGTTGVQMAVGATSWSSVSDRAAKEEFERLDYVQFLTDFIAAVPITRWKYRARASPGSNYVGPIAQDWATLGLGEDADRGVRIDTINPAGVALACVHGLKSLIDGLEERIGRLEAASSANKK